jgi:hypothetical protein
MSEEAPLLVARPPVCVGFTGASALRQCIHRERKQEHRQQRVFHIAPQLGIFGQHTADSANE